MTEVILRYVMDAALAKAVDWAVWIGDVDI